MSVFRIGKKSKIEDNELEFIDEIDELDWDYSDDGDFETVDSIDKKVVQDEKSDDTYQETASRIVDISEMQLNNQHDSKMILQKRLLWFFIALLSVQTIAIIAVVLLNGFWERFTLNDGVVISFITSAFVETLGVVALMVKFAFYNEQETKIISILNSYIEHFKVYNSSEHKSNMND